MNNNIKTVWETKNDDVIEGMLKLKAKYGIEDLRAIELYCGDGHSISDKMSKQCISYIGYDIEPGKEEGFRKNVVNGEFRCGDSVKMMDMIKEGELGTYNLVSTDAPVCIYGNNYCEHFEVLNYVYKLFESGETVMCVFPVVPKPYDTEKEENIAWMRRREAYYKTTEKNLNLEKTCLVYDRVFEKQGLKPLERSYICREYRDGVDWLYEYMYVLQKM